MPVSEWGLGILGALVIFNVVLSTSFQDALFLTHHKKDGIPPAMLLGSLVTAATSLGLTRFLRQASPAAALRVILLGLAVVSAGFGVWNLHPDRRSTFALFLFVELSTTLGVAATWTYFQAPLEPSQIRKLMPRLGIWAGAGGLIAGGVIPLVMKRLSHPEYLIILSAAAWALAGLQVRMGHTPKQQRAGRRKGGIRQVFRLPLLPWIALGSGGIVWMGLLLQYETRVALQQHLTPPEIARTMGMLLAATSVAGIFVQGLLTTPILERWGVGLALAVLPVSVAVMLGLYTTVPLLALIAGAFLIDKTLRPNLHRPAESCLMAAVAPQHRPSLMLVVGSILQPLLKAAGALALWAAAASVAPRTLLLVALAITAGLVALSTRFGKLYADTLRETLEDGSVDMIGEGDADEMEALVPLIDGPRLQILMESIDKGSPRARELSLELLRPHRSGLVRRAMQARLEDDRPGVRIAALRWFTDEPTEALAPYLQRRWVEPDLGTDERIALLQAAGKGAPALLGDELARWLTAPEVELRSAVILALLGSEQHRDAAERVIIDLLHSYDPETCIAGLRLVRELGDARFLPAVLLLRRRFSEDREAHREVRRQLLSALPSLPSPQARAPLWESLEDPQLAHVAVRALASCGAQVVPEIADALAQPATSALARLNLLRTLGQIQSRMGIASLMQAVDGADRAAQLEALKSLSQLRRWDLWSPTEAQRERLEEYTLEGLRYGLRLRRCRDLLRRQRMPSSLVLRELEAQIDAAQQRVFRALSLVGSAEALARVFRTLRSPTSPHRDQARELLRTVVKGGPLALGSAFLFDQGLPWSDELYRPPLSVFSERSPDAVVLWLASTRDPWILSALRHDPGYPVSVPLDATEGDPMQASLETILFLKDVALFEPLTNQQLVEVAKLAEKVEYPASHTLCQQGDVADYLYLVRKGKLIVKVAGQEVARLGPGECAGEMAVLSGTERTATVETADACHLLRFEAEHFLQLLETYPEIGRGLLKSLVKRLAAVGGPKKGARPATMTGMVWGKEGPPTLVPKDTKA